MTHTIQRDPFPYPRHENDQTFAGQKAQRRRPFQGTDLQLAQRAEPWSRLIRWISSWKVSTIIAMRPSQEKHELACNLKLLLLITGNQSSRSQLIFPFLDGFSRIALFTKLQFARNWIIRYVLLHVLARSTSLNQNKRFVCARCSSIELVLFSLFQRAFIPC